MTFSRLCQQHHPLLLLWVWLLQRHCGSVWSCGWDGGSPGFEPKTVRKHKERSAGGILPVPPSVRTMQSQCRATLPVIQKWCTSVFFLLLCPFECLQTAHEGGDSADVTQSVPSMMTWGAYWTTITLNSLGNSRNYILFSLDIAFILLFCPKIVLGNYIIS